MSQGYARTGSLILIFQKARRLCVYGLFELFEYSENWRKNRVKSYLVLKNLIVIKNITFILQNV